MGVVNKYLFFKNEFVLETPGVLLFLWRV